MRLILFLILSSMSLLKAIKIAQHEWLLEQLQNPNIPWNWTALSSNRNITWEIVKVFPDKEWDWNSLSCNENITLEIVIENPDKPWSSNGLSYNPNLTWEFVKTHPELKWNISGLSEHKCVTWDIVQANPHMGWIWYTLSHNQNITWEIIKANPDKPWDWSGISRNKNITWEIIEANPDKPWCWWNLGSNLDITWEKIKNNLDKKWDWTQVSANKNITLDIINANISNLKYPLCNVGLSKNPNITPAFVKAHPNQKWYYKLLSQNPKFFLDDLIKCERTWLMYDVESYNPHITLEYALSRNKNDWWNLSLNKNITKMPIIQLSKVIRKYFATRSIQRAFKECYYNPSFQLCHNRLHREFENMKDDL